MASMALSRDPDHEVDIRTSLLPHAGTFDLSWARDHIKNFAKYESEVHQKVADEKRYKNQEGYVPSHEPDIRAAARRAYECYTKMYADVVIAGLRVNHIPRWDELSEQVKGVWEQVAQAVLLCA